MLQKPSKKQRAYIRGPWKISCIHAAEAILQEENHAFGFPPAVPKPASELLEASGFSHCRPRTRMENTHREGCVYVYLYMCIYICTVYIIYIMYIYIYVMYKYIYIYMYVVFCALVVC